MRYIHSSKLVNSALKIGERLNTAIKLNFYKETNETRPWKMKRTRVSFRGGHCQGREAWQCENAPCVECGKER